MNLKEAWSAWLPEKILGYTVGKDKKQLKSFAPPPPDDGAVNLEVGGAYGTYLDLEGNIRNELELITKYRELAIQPECEAAVEDIVNEAVVMDGFKVAVELELSEAKHLSDKIKEKIYLEFQGILDMLNFQTDAHDIFRKWYVDGKIYYHMIADENNTKQGIQELRYIDPRKIRKIREVVREPDPNGVDMVKRTVEFYVYDEGGVSDASQGLSGIKITPDSIAMSNSDLRAAQRTLKPPMEKGDLKTLELSAAMCNRFLGTSFPETGYRIEYQTIPLSKEEMEAIRKDTIEKEQAGYITKIDAVKVFNPDFSDQEAAEYLREVRRQQIEFNVSTI